MSSLIPITIEVLFALFIAGSIYIIAICFFKFSNHKSGAPGNNKSSQNLHFAVVFNNFINEKDLINQIQFLTSQSYPDYTAYFFIDAPFVSVNNLHNIRIIQSSQEHFSRSGLINISKKYFQLNHKAVLLVEPGTNLSTNYFQEMNNYLSNGYHNLDQIPMYFLLATKNPIAYMNSFKVWLRSFFLKNKYQSFRHLYRNKGFLHQNNEASFTI